MNKVNQLIKDGITIPSLNKTPFKFKIYESNISPFIRFIHTKEVAAAGWVKIPGGKYLVNRGEDKTSQCQIDIDIDFDTIEPIENNTIAPMLIASFDIECSSSHGDFPLPKKNYKKLGCEIYDGYKKFNGRSKKSKSEQQDYLRECIELAFDSTNKSKATDIKCVYTIDEEKPCEKIKTKGCSAIY